MDRTQIDKQNELLYTVLMIEELLVIHTRRFPLLTAAYFTRTVFDPTGSAGPARLRSGRSFLATSQPLYGASLTYSLHCSDVNALLGDVLDDAIHGIVSVRGEGR